MSPIENIVGIISELIELTNSGKIWCRPLFVYLQSKR